MHQENNGSITILERKLYRWWKFFAASILLPTLICSVGIAHFGATGNQAALWVTAFFGLVIGCVLFAIYRVEWVQLHQQPLRIFTCDANGPIEIQGERFEEANITDIMFEYTFYQHGTGTEGGAFSELDIVVKADSHTRRFNLLSQKSNWALKHARSLHQLTQIPLKRTVVTK